MGLCQSNERVVTQSRPSSPDENNNLKHKPSNTDKIYTPDELIKKLSYNKDDDLKIALLKLEVSENCKEIQLQKEIILEMKRKIQDLKSKKLTETSSEAIKEINLEISRETQNLSIQTNQFQKQLVTNTRSPKLQPVIHEVPFETENVEDSLILRADEQLLESTKKILKIQSLQENSFIALNDPTQLKKMESEILIEKEEKKQQKKSHKKPYQFEQQFAEEQFEEEQKVDLQQEQKMKKLQQQKMNKSHQQEDEEDFEQQQQEQFEGEVEELTTAEQQQFDMKLNDIDHLSDSDSESQQLETTDDEDESFQAHRFVKSKGVMDPHFSNFAINTIKHYLIMQQQLEAQFEAKEKRNNELLDHLEKNCLECIKVERQLSQVMKSSQRVDLEKKKKKFVEEKDSIEEEIDQLLKEKIICLTQMEEYQKLVDMSNVDLVEKFKKVYQQFLYEIQEELVNYENQLDLVTDLEGKIKQRDYLYVVEEECNSEQDMDEYQRNQEDLQSPLRKPSISYTDNNDSDTESILKNADYKHNNAFRNEFDIEIFTLREVIDEFISDSKMRRLSVVEILEQKEKLGDEIQMWLQKLTKAVADQRQKYDFHKNKLNQYIENHPDLDENQVNKEENIKNFKNNLKINLKFQIVNQEKFGGDIEQIEQVPQEDDSEDQDFIRNFDEQLFPTSSKLSKHNNTNNVNAHQQQQKLKQKKSKKSGKKSNAVPKKKKNSENNVTVKSMKVNQLTNQVNAMKKKKHRRAKKNQNAAQLLINNQA